MARVNLNGLISGYASEVLLAEEIADTVFVPMSDLPDNYTMFKNPYYDSILIKSMSERHEPLNFDF